MKLMHNCPFRSTIQHKAFVTDVLYQDPEAAEDYWTHLMCGVSLWTCLLRRLGRTLMCLRSCAKKVLNAPSEEIPLREDATSTQLTRMDQVHGLPVLPLTSPLLSLEGMTGFIVFQLREGSRLSDYWQERSRGLSPNCAV